VTVGNLGWDEARFPEPVFHWDAIRVESEVLEVSSSRSRPENGIVILAHRGYNQRNEIVMTRKRSALMLRRSK
jgi:acyl dehydratase